MSQSYFFQKKEAFDRGVYEVRTLLRGRDVATLPRAECAKFAERYEALQALCLDMCSLSRTDASKTQYQDLAVRLGERARTLRMLASGKSIKATPEERRARLTEEFEKRRAEIKKRLGQRRLESLSASELESLAKKYEKLAYVARSISEIARTQTDEKKYAEFYEKLMCRSAELLASAKKLSARERKKSTPAATSEGKPELSQTEDLRTRKLRDFRSLSLSLTSDYSRLVALATELAASAVSDSEREEYEYYQRYLAEGAEFYEAVIKKEIQTLSADDILALETK